MTEENEITSMEARAEMFRQAWIARLEENAVLRAALEHIAALPPITDAATGYSDDSAQETAREALSKATTKPRAAD